MHELLDKRLETLSSISYGIQRTTDGRVLLLRFDGVFGSGTSGNADGAFICSISHC